MALLGGGGSGPNLATWTSELAAIGAFAAPIPFATADPGALGGVDDLVSKGISTAVAGKTTWDDLTVDDLDVTLPDNRKGTLTIQPEDLAGGGKRVHVELEVTRTTEAGLTVSSTSPKVELAAPKGLQAEVSASMSLWVVWTGKESNRTYLATDTAHAPHITVDVTARLAAGVKASVGILGVALSSTDFTITSKTVAKINDPNNDGVLSFAAGDGGELAAPGSLQGLVSVGPGTPAGSVTGTLSVKADTSGLGGITLPAPIAADIKVSWPDISTGAPTITAPDLAAQAGKFQNMSLRDLADGLAQVATALTGIQQAKFAQGGSLVGNLDLPFMRGTVADAVKANEALVEFLKANVNQPPDPDKPSPNFDASRVGTPKFTSLQDLVTKLGDFAGIDLDGLAWDAATSKLSFHLTMTKATSPVPMDAGSAKTSKPGATYGPAGLTLSDGTSPWTPGQWVGMRVVAGTSAGEVKANTEGSLTLAGPWIGGQPSDTTPFVISGPEAQLGAVTFGDSLTEAAGADLRKGILRANAGQTFAEVTPSVTADLTLVLDLQDPLTGEACKGFEGNTEPCSFSQETGAFKTRVDSLPLGADRVMIRTGGATPLLRADFPIKTKVDLTANAGFFQVHLKGNLQACNSTAPENCSANGSGNMLTVGLKAMGDAQHDLRLRQLFDTLVTDGPTGPSKAGNLLDVKLNVRAYADLTVSVPGTEHFLPDGASATAKATWNDLTKTSGADGPQFDLSRLEQIFALDFKPGSQAELFAIVLKTLQTLAAELAEAQPGGPDGIFSTKIPGTGTTLRDLMRRDTSGVGADVSYGANSLTDTGRTFDSSFTGRTVVVGTQVGVVASASDHTVTLTKNWATPPAKGTAYTFRSPLDDAIDIMAAHPPQNLQDLVAFVNQRLGTDTLSFRYLDGGGTPSVVLALDWKRDYQTAAPLRLDLGGDHSLVAAAAEGQGTVHVTGGVDVGLVVPLAPGTGPDDATSLKVLAQSKLSIAADARLTGHLTGTIGPLTVSAGDPGGDKDKQAKVLANLSLDLANPSAVSDAPVTFSTFLSSLKPGFNASSTPVDCGEGLSTKLMVCGVVPLYATVAGGAPSALGTIALRVPKTTDPADLTTLTGNLPSPDASKPRLEVPDLTTAFQQAFADFTQIGPGLDGYLEKIEQAMRLAAFDGKLPFVGSDLQQGADSISKLRAQIKAKLGDIPATPEEARDYVNTQLADAITAAGLSRTSLTVGYVCALKLEPTAAPNLAATPADPGDGTWSYKIVASQGSGSGTDGDTVPSAPSAALKTKFTTLDGDHTIKVSWTSTLGAKKYKVLRSQDGTTFELVKVVDPAPGAAQSFTDDGSATPSAYAAVSEKPMLVKCPQESTTGISLSFDIKQGEINSTDGCKAGTGCIGGSVPLDIGIPGLALKAGPDDSINYAVGLELHLKAAVTKDKGFVVYTHDAWKEGAAAPEFGVGARFDMPATMSAQLAFLDIGVKKNNTAPLFAGAFLVDLKSGDGDETGTSTLTFADIAGGDAGSIFGISLTAEINADWIVSASADSVLPGVQANFLLGWKFSNKDLKNLGAPTIGFKDVQINAGAFFSNLLGPVLKQVKTVTGPLQPVIDTLYAPLPVLSDLSKLAGGGDVSLISLGKTFNTLAGGADLAFVNTLLALTKLVNDLPSCGGGTDCLIPIGAFTVDGSKALTTSVSPTSALDPGETTSLIEKAEPKGGVKDALNAAAGNRKVFGTDADKGSANESGLTFPILDKPASVFSLLMGSDVSLVEFDSGPLTLGFTWRQSFGPVYAPPPVMVTLSGSASVSLRFMAGLDTAGIRYAVEAARSGTKVDAVKLLDGLYFKTTDANGRPVPVVRLDGEIAAGAAVSALIIEVGIEGGLHLTIGFHWNDPNNDGKFRVSEFAKAAINNPLCLFTTTGRLSLFLRVYITIGFSPLSTSFSFTLADVTLLDFTAQPNCAPPPPRLGGTSGDTLIVFAGKFGTDDARGAPWGNTPDTEADVVKVTELHFVPRAGDENGTNPDFDGFRIQMLGESRDYLDTNLARVVVDGRDSHTKLIVTFAGDGKKDGTATSATTQADLTRFTKDAVVFGTDQDDQIQTGTGNSWVDGGEGNDRIVTADVAGKVARVAGGPGDDAITTGDGDDLVSGDGALPQVPQTVDAALNQTDIDNQTGTPKMKKVTLKDLVDWTKLDVDPTKGDQGVGGADVIAVGLGQNRVNGGPGGDTISVAPDRSDGKNGTITSKGNVLIGENGSDSIAGGSAADTIFASTENEFGFDDNGEPDVLDAGRPNVIETGSGNDVVYGSQSEDIVTSHSLPGQHAKIIGGAGPDALVGGYGTDEIYGGPGDDYVIAEPSEVGALGGDDTIEAVFFGKQRAVRHLPLPEKTLPAAKTLVGGLGNDHILGGDGPSTIFGDTLRDATNVGAADDESCLGGTAVTSDPVPEGTKGPARGGEDGNDLILGGAGIDTISAGGADDRVLAGGGADRVCGQEGNDVLFGGDGADHMWSGSGNDRAYGDAGDDLVFGNDGEDNLYGQDGADVIEGNDGADRASGGAGPDRIYGGTRAEGRQDIGPATDRGAGDILSGDTGDDVIIGDNGSVDDPTNSADAPAQPFDLDGAKPNAGRGDLIYGGDGADVAYGGLGGDRIWGGNGPDHLEGNNGSDVIHGGDGEDEIVGGSFQMASNGVGRPDDGDVLYGDAGTDVIAGDNAVIITTDIEADATPVTRNRGFEKNHVVQLLDLDPTATPGNWGDDEIYGGDDADVIFGQRGNDRLKGDAGDDYAEGGPGLDWVEGNAGDDDLVGGSSDPSRGSADGTVGQPDAADVVFGGPGDDVAIGDNGQILRPEPGQQPNSATVRLGSKPGTAMTTRIIETWDRITGTGYLGTPDATRYGADRISGGDGVDVILGQDGDDILTGDSGDDYLEGNGGADKLFGDLALDAESTHGTQKPGITGVTWPGTASSRDLLIGTSTEAGQDDLIGGTPTRGYRDGDDTIEGNGADDVVLGDNGSLVRTLVGADGSQSERVYVDRYPDGAVPANATRSRTHDPALPGPSTRFCTTAQTTCEPLGAFGADTIWGDDGNDGIWGQDGDDVIRGGAGDDDLYGELGEDRIWGDAGRDAIVGDRGGIVNQFLSDGDSPQAVTVTLSSPPQETFSGFVRGAYDRRVDLLHDVDGDQWIGTSTDAPMPHAGLTEGGRDLIRGGPDGDTIHGGYGDDVINGDSGGDDIFGGDGEDVIWGGKGCDPVLDATTADCLTGGVFDATSRGNGDRFVDHIFGGRGESDPTKQDILGSDVMDVRPRGSYAPGSGCTLGDWPLTTGSKKAEVTVDPCLWFEMTDMNDADVTNDNHHQGTDWIYGGWDRDVMQADLAANGPNNGDRLIDWNGAYNLFTHCNAAYGGFNDVRQHSPAMQGFLQTLAWASSAGRGAVDVTTPGTSAFVELALVYPSDNIAHGSGPAYPGTPGHFEQTACLP